MTLLKRFWNRKRKPRRGVLTFEWILLVTILVIGIIGGLGGVRTAIVGELQDLKGAIESLNIKPEAECNAEGVPETNPPAPGC